MSPHVCELGLAQNYMVVDIIYSVPATVLSALRAFNSDNHLICLTSLSPFTVK